MEVDQAVAAVSRFEITPAVLDTVCRLTGMGFAAIARVTDTKWIACATKDDISFGLGPGGELELESTICNEIRQRPEPVVRLTTSGSGCHAPLESNRQLSS